MDRMKSEEGAGEADGEERLRAKRRERPWDAEKDEGWSLLWALRSIATRMYLL